MSKTTSYPKDKIKILLLENISENSSAEFRDNGYVSFERISGALSEEQLISIISDIHILGIRSKTQLTAGVLRKASKLLAVGCYCIGVNQVDLLEAERLGIAVFNAPHANTRSVAELVIGLSIMLIRRIPEKNAAAHRGIWLKDAKNAFELRGKTIGIVGYGNIGSQVSILAESLGMDVIFYDVEPKLAIGNAKPQTNLKSLLKRSHIVTLHVPGNSSTKQLLNMELINEMKKGATLINLSRGDVIDLRALQTALDNGFLAGAALDVFPEEPEKNGDPFQSVFQSMDQVILTPHIGGSTEEAQMNIGQDVTAKLLRYLERGVSTGSLTIPQLSLTPQDHTHRLLHIHENKPGILGEINSTLSAHQINISGQFLKTNSRIGYVVLDIDSRLSPDALKLLKKVQGTIKTRILY